ncbi:hypothetical protein R3P38DRAFT_3169711 [Favolaschia claudopus]|uniref:Uncharacterized protein n=1 Tax=Favolaschia claudopus TaxID=2862362 RepID=A0AAW0DZT6_9AGAR
MLLRICHGLYSTTEEGARVKDSVSDDFVCVFNLFHELATLGPSDEVLNPSPAPDMRLCVSGPILSFQTFIDASEKFAVTSPSLSVRRYGRTVGSPPHWLRTLLSSHHRCRLARARLQRLYGSQTAGLPWLTASRLWLHSAFFCPEAVSSPREVQLPRFVLVDGLKLNELPSFRLVGVSLALDAQQMSKTQMPLDSDRKFLGLVYPVQRRY